MRTRRWFYGVALVVTAGLLSLVAPVLNETTNCGGNTAALSKCQNYHAAVWVEASDITGQSFFITNVTGKAREQFAEMARDKSWTGQAHYLVSTQAFIPTKSEDHRILIVCDRAYTNVPKHWYWHAPPTHAVCYFDGRSGLISPSEFAALDLSMFKRLDELFPERTR